MDKLNDTNMIFCNEFSKNRIIRLKNNIDDFIPENKKQIIKVITGFDAYKIELFQKKEYDKILLDVPCSSGRHVINDTKNIENRSKTKSKYLQNQLHSMLQFGIMSLKKEGKLICSISPLENDGFIEKTFKEDKYTFKILRLSNTPNYEEYTDYGYQIFPDRPGERSSIYFSILKKL